MGYSYAEKGIHLDEAEKLILGALKIKPENGYMLDSLGWVYLKKNNLKRAEKYLKKALDLLPDETEIIEHMGDVFAKQKRFKEAREMYERALKINPENVFLQKKIDALNKQKP